MPPGVTLKQADMSDLPFGVGAFQAIVSFEAIEHVPDPFRVLDEFRRVLTDDGVLIVSSPNRDAYVPGNPHHNHEFEPEELRSALRERFRNVVLHRQACWITSAIFDDELLESDDRQRIRDVSLRKIVSMPAGDETYTIAVATNGSIPATQMQGVMTHAVELRRWLALWDEQQQMIQANIDRGNRAEEQLAERAELRRQLLVSEQSLARAVAERADAL
jgi:hypothetical protein